MRVLHYLSVLRLCSQLGRAVALALLGKIIEVIPLRHEGDEAATRRQTYDLGNPESCFAELRIVVEGPVLRQRQELVQPTQVVHQLER